MTGNPLTVQWYRLSTGTGPWVRCVGHGGRLQMCLWVEGAWDQRIVEYPDPNDIEAAATRIWDFIRQGLD
jgi:hypothetical protein